jgi:hypothetical protein
MDIKYLIAVFERKLMLQRYSAGSIKNYSSSVRSFLQVAEKRFDQSDELNENEIEKYVYRKIREDHISSSYRFANVLFCSWTVHFIVFFFFCLYVANCPLCRFLHLSLTGGGVTSGGARVTFSSPDENARAGKTAPKFQCQPTLATPLVGGSSF